MTKKNSLLAFLPLAVGVAITGCSTLANLQLPTTVQQQVQSGDLTLRFSGFETQAIADVHHVDVTLTVGASVATRSIPVANLTQSQTFTNIPCGQGNLIVKAFNASGTEIGQSQQFVTVLPGKTTGVAVELYIGGSSATDLAFEFLSTEGRFFVDKHYDWYPGFKLAYPQNFPTWVYELSSNGATQSFSYETIAPNCNVQLTKTGGTINYSWDDFFARLFTLPGHAELVDAQDPFGKYNNVRHFRYTNTFKVNSQDVTYTIDRYYASEIGLIRETLTKDGTVTSTLDLKSHTTQQSETN